MTTLFSALDIATGTVIGKYGGCHHATEYFAFLTEMEATVPDGLDVHLLLQRANRSVTEFNVGFISFIKAHNEKPRP